MAQGEDCRMLASPAGAAPLKFRNDMRLGEVWVAFFVWLLVSACTLGLGWIIVSGHFFKLIINYTKVVDADGRVIGHLKCDYDVEREMRLVVIWLLVSIATLGIGLLLYSFHAARAALNATEIVWE
jgi:hypothetical protein